MKLASLKSRSNRDGQLALVSRNLSKMLTVTDIAPALQYLLEHWQELASELEIRYQQLNQNQIDSEPFDPAQLLAPLPRAYQWLDASAYLSHVERVRKARGAELPDNLLHDPLMYQGASDHLLSANTPIYCSDINWGADFEAEVAVITDDVPQSVSKDQAAKHIKLLVLINDVSFRNLIPAELAKGFGFIQGKPATAFSPVAITPDELGQHWHDNKIHRPLYVHWNEKLFGRADAGTDMQFDFAQLINHAAMTRQLSAGSIIGSGTVSNYNPETGCSCIVEQRVREILDLGEIKTGYLQYGDRVRIEMLDSDHHSIFGAINQEVKACL